MRYWWVNQNQTYDYEVHGGFLWSPKLKANGGYNYFYATMAEVSPGDIVFSFCATEIKAIGIVQSRAETTPKPNFQSAGSNWSDVGWYVQVEFKEVDHPFRPRDYMQAIAPLLRSKYAPLQKDGRGLQGIYLTEISSQLGSLLAHLSQEDIEWLSRDLAPVPEDEVQDDELDTGESKFLDGELEKIQLTRSRRGQGLFRANVRLVERGCRVTGLSIKRHLVASHIKPWRHSDNFEKLDGHNGLLLSPHVDHLFDKGYISFEDSGHLLVSRELNPSVLEKWRITEETNVGPFSPQQSGYLDYHRSHMFQR